MTRPASARPAAGRAQLRRERHPALPGPGLASGAALRDLLLHQADGALRHVLERGE